MQRGETLSAISPLLRHRALRVLLVAAPGLMAAVAILTATESNLTLIIVLNLAAAVVISSVLFLAVSLVAHQVADERVGLVQAAEQGFWHARTQHLSIHSGETGLYADWYFRLRLQEEIERSRRYGMHFAVVLVKMLEPHEDTQVEKATEWFGDHIRRHLRRSDLSALLQNGSLGLLLPHTGRHAALQCRLTKALASADARVGLACFPEDGEDVTGLLTAAAHAAIGELKTGAA